MNPLARLTIGATATALALTYLAATPAGACSTT